MKKLATKSAILFTLFLIGSATLTSAQKHTIVLEFDNIINVEGVLSIGIFDNEDDFLNEGNEFKKLVLKVTNNKVIYKVDVPKGAYAISVYHDKNSDAECNRNFLGVPQEQYGFSNNFKPKLSAPKFNQCKFYTADNKKIKISLID